MTQTPKTMEEILFDAVLKATKSGRLSWKSQQVYGGCEYVAQVGSIMLTYSYLGGLQLFRSLDEISLLTYNSDNDRLLRSAIEEQVFGTSELLQRVLDHLEGADNEQG